MCCSKYACVVPVVSVVMEILISVEPEWNDKESRCSSKVFQPQSR